MSVLKIQQHDYNRNGTTAEYVHNVAERVREIIQFCYDWYIQLFGREAIAFDIAGAMCLTMTVFWLLGAFYTLLDVIKKPFFLYKYKTQDDDGVRTRI